MKNFNLLQIVPSLESGGVEQGTIDVANFLGEKDLGSFIVSNGGNMLTLLNSKKTKHIKLPVHSKNILAMPFIARKLNQTIKDNKINIVHVRSRAPAWFLQFIQDKKFKTGFYRQMQAFLFMIKTGKLEWPGQNLSDILNTVKLTQTINRH